MFRRTFRLFRKDKYYSLSELNVALSDRLASNSELETNDFSTSLFSNSHQEYEDDYEDFNFLSQSAKTRSRFVDGSQNNSSFSSIEIQQTPEKALRVAESAIAAPQNVGYAYAILPIVDIVLEAHKRGLLFDGDENNNLIQKELENNNNNIIVDDDVDDEELFFKPKVDFERDEPPVWTSQYQQHVDSPKQQNHEDVEEETFSFQKGTSAFSQEDNNNDNETSKKTKKKPVHHTPKKHRKFHFARWFPHDPLTLCRSPQAMIYTAGTERASLISKLIFDMFKEHEGVFSPSQIIQEKIPPHLVSPSPLTRVMNELGMLQNSSIELPYKKLLRGIAIATFRNDIYLDLPVLSTAIIQNDPRLFLMANNSSGNVSAKNDGKKQHYTIKSNYFKQQNQQTVVVVTGHLPSLNVVLHEMKLQGKFVNNFENENRKLNIDEEDDLPPLFLQLRNEEPKSSAKAKSSDDQESDRAAIWVKLLLGVAAESGSYSCALHAAEIMKQRNMQTTMPIQRLMSLSCHAHTRRELDWKFRHSSGLRSYGKKWVNEYFPKILKK
jgi:hypothetical protein